jgi:hypothetical protein
MSIEIYDKLLELFIKIAYKTIINVAKKKQCAEPLHVKAPPVPAREE